MPYRTTTRFGVRDGVNAPDDRDARVTSANTPLNPPASAQKPDFVEGLREDLLHNDPLLDYLVELRRYRRLFIPLYAIFRVSSQIVRVTDEGRHVN